MIGHKCKKCMWWDNEHERLAIAENGFGYCRKHKPVVYLADNKYFGGWPLVDKNDFCGEFREDK